MKLHTTIASLIVGSFCLVSAGTLHADNVSNSQSDPSKHHHDSNSTGGTGSSSDESSGVIESYQGWATKDSQLSNHQGQSPQAINKASSLVGMTVKNQNGDTLGKVKDIVFDQDSGRVSYVVLEKADKAPGTQANVAVPLTAFTPSDDAKSLTLNVDKDRVSQARGFASDNMPPVGSPMYGAQPTGEEVDIFIVPKDSDNSQDKDNSNGSKNHLQNE
jgi:sporulation protein YlmC with PRC-barrel domain